MRRILALLLAAPLAACAAVPQAGSPAPTSRPPVIQGVPATRPAAPVITGFRAPPMQRLPGLEGVIEQDATGLQRLFGQPRLDVREGDMRKLQFSSQACVLDVFLYPLRQGAEPVATYVEARRASDGAEVDRVACVNALRPR